MFECHISEHVNISQIPIEFNGYVLKNRLLYSFPNGNVSTYYGTELNISIKPAIMQERTTFFEQGTVWSMAQHKTEKNQDNFS